MLSPRRAINTFTKQRFAVAGASPRVRGPRKLAGAVFPPVGKLCANRGELGLRVDETVAIHDRELVLVAHRNCVDWTDLRAESAEKAATGAEDELTQLPVPFLRRHDVH